MTSLNNLFRLTLFSDLSATCRSQPFDTATRDVTIHILRAGADRSSRGLFTNCYSKPRWKLHSLPGCSA